VPKKPFAKSLRFCIAEKVPIPSVKFRQWK
jgi:hypothetical protein